MATTLEAPAAPAAADNPHHARRWLILAILATAQLMVVLDATIVNIALPSAQRALAFSDGNRQWVVTAYALAFGSLLLLGGRLADLFGRKRIFMVGLVGFALASAAGGASTGFGMLVTARAVQGAFGALLAPAALALLTTTFTDREERAKAFGIFGAIAGGGAAVGLLLGGVLTEYLSWRWCMYVNLAFAVVSFAGASAYLRHVPSLNRPRLDVTGIVLGSAGLFCLVYGFAHAETSSWGNALTVLFLVAGVALLVAFVVVQTRTTNPVLPMRVVLDRNRGGSYLAIFILGVGMFGVFLFLTYYLQLNLRFSAIRSGLAFLPMVAGIVTFAQIGSLVLAERVGPRYIVAPGMAIAAVGMFLLTHLGVGSSYAGGVLPGLVVFGAGLGLVFSSAMSVATAGVQPEDAGVASATVNTAQQVGGSIGTALLNTIAASAATAYAGSHAGGPLLQAQASVHSFTTAFGWASAILAAGAVITAVVLRPEVPDLDPDAVAVHA